MDVAVVGSCNIDLMSYVPHLPKPGETLHGHRFTIGYGGKGANQCVMSSRLGAKSTMIAKIGDDTFGKEYIKNLQDSNINTDHMRVTKDASTGTATISVADNGENAIVVVAGANGLLSREDVIRAEEVIASSKVLICQLETQLDTVISALKLANKYKVKTVLNPAPAQKNLPDELYKLSDIFCPNETEAEILTGRPVGSVKDAEMACEVLLERGCGTALITLGDKGAVIAERPGCKPIHVPAQSVKAVDTTGAGDAFVGALAFYLSTMPSLGLQESVSRAGQVATVSVQAAGAQTSYPARKQLPDYLFSV